MTSSTLAAPAATLPHQPAREHCEADPAILQDIERHLRALRGMCGHVTRPTLQRLMSIEIGLTLAELRRFVLVREAPAASLNPSD